MKEITKHYVTYYYPGIIISELDSKEIKSRPKNERGFKIPDGAYGYMFYDIKLLVKGKETFTGKPINKSPLYVYGDDYNLERVKKECPDHDILISNMEINEIDTVVRTKFGQFLEKHDNYFTLKE